MMDAVERARRSRDEIVIELRAAGAEHIGSSMRCPYHDDTRDSGGIYQDEGGVWRYKCHVPGCFGGDVFDIRARRNNTTPSAEMKAESKREEEKMAPAKNTPTYQTVEDLRAALGQGATLYEYCKPGTSPPFRELIVARVDLPDGTKKISQWHETVDRLISGGKPAGLAPLYNRGRVALADEVLVVEGEKCVHAAHGIAVVATTSPGGASAAARADWKPLSGKKKVIIWADNDEAGAAYCKDVYSQLCSLPQPPREIIILDTSRLALPPKGDIADWISANGGTKKKYAECILRYGKGEKISAYGALRRRYEMVVSGEYDEVMWPIESLRQHTAALLPGTVTVIGGSPGCGKSLFLTQCLEFWYRQDVKCKYIALEDDAAHHANRILAQMMENRKVLSVRGMREYAYDIDEYMNGHEEDLVGVLDSIWAPGKMQNLVELPDRVAEHINDGARIVMIDPVTAAQASSKRYVDDGVFIGKLHEVIQGSDCSVIVCTHFAKGATNAMPALDDLAGGAAYSRLTQTVLHLHRYYPQQTLQIEGGFGEVAMGVDHVMRILKSRNANGLGREIALELGRDDLKFREIGMIRRAR